MRKRELQTIINYLQRLSKPGQPARLTITMTPDEPDQLDSESPIDPSFSPVFKLYEAVDYPMGIDMTLDEFASVCVGT